MLDPLPILPLKDTVVYPQIVVPLAVGRPRSLAAIEAAMQTGRQFIAVAQRNRELSDPTLEDLYEIGTLVKISRVEKQEQGA